MNGERFGIDSRAIFPVTFASAMRSVPFARVWFQLVSRAWFEGYKLEWIGPGRFRLTPRVLPFSCECTVAL